MHRIFSEQGKLLISAGVFFALVVIFGIATYNNRTGIRAIFGGELEDSITTTVADGDYTTSAYETYIGRKEPSVSYVSYDDNGNWQQIKAGSSVHLSDFFSGTDSDGNDVVLLKITELTDAAGNSLIDTYDDTTGNITFAEAGVYTATFYLKDNNNVETTMLVTFPVDN